ncbi:MAG: transketolase family protein [Clostridiales Family XIII bacterium]|jgi:transketolase|nr:transketolase family protein [Clostridiales Family XIII bacterium]
MMTLEMRTVLRETLAEEMTRNEKILLFNADLGKANDTHVLEDAFPGRAINLGIAEQNILSISAGAASYGMIPIVNTFAAFASRRACDQIAISVAYANQNVKIIGTDPGISAELNGGTHMGIEDIGVLRSIPNITLMEACDAEELRQMIRYMNSVHGPFYLRMPRRAILEVHEPNYKFRFGKADLLRQGKDVTIIASGITVTDAVQAASELANSGIDAELINMHTLKPIDAEGIVQSAMKTGAIVTVENHNVLGGLRSAVAEAVTEKFPVRIYPLGIRDRKGQVGRVAYLKEAYGFDANSICETAIKAVREKRSVANAR